MAKAKTKLNPKQELFCQLYATDKEFFGNGVQTYIEVYAPDQTKKNWYNVARASAAQILANINICNRITELIDASGLNDQHADKQLLLVMTQNADFSSKVAALREYNKLKNRIIERSKIEHTLPKPILEGLSKIDNAVSTDDSNEETSAA